MEPNNNQNNDQDPAQSQYFDPFPEPQTIPAGWDTSTILSAPVTTSAQEVEDTAEN